MSTPIQAWTFSVVAVAGWIQYDQQAAIVYLLEEHRVLKARSTAPTLDPTGFTPVIGRKKTWFVHLVGHPPNSNSATQRSVTMTPANVSNPDVCPIPPIARNASPISSMSPLSTACNPR